MRCLSDSATSANTPPPFCWAHQQATNFERGNLLKIFRVPYSLHILPSLYIISSRQKQGYIVRSGSFKSFGRICTPNFWGKGSNLKPPTGELVKDDVYFECSPISTTQCFKWVKKNTNTGSLLIFTLSRLHVRLKVENSTLFVGQASQN